MVSSIEGVILGPGGEVEDPPRLPITDPPPLKLSPPPPPPGRTVTGAHCVATNTTPLLPPLGGGHRGVGTQGQVFMYRTIVLKNETRKYQLELHLAREAFDQLD